MARTTGDTFAEALKKIVGMLAESATLPDADLQFSTGLQLAIAKYMQQATAAVTGGGNTQLQQPGAGGMGGGMGGPAGMPLGATPGLTQGGPNMDEMRRALAAGMAG